MTDDETPPPPREADGYAAPADYSGSSHSGVVRASSQPRMSPAEWSYERLIRQIAAYEAKLTPGEEIGGRMTSGPGDGAFQIEDVGWWGPDMIVFYGRNGAGRPIQLIQHYTQLNVLLTPMTKVTAEPARRIGFELSRRLRSKTPVRALAGQDDAQRAESDSAA